MEVSFVTALLIMAIKVKIKGSLLCIETYASLGNGSNFPFRLASLMERLMVVGMKTRLKLTTVDSSNGVDSAVCNDLMVADLDENVAILLQKVLSRLATPVGRDEIPKQEDVER